MSHCGIIGLGTYLPDSVATAKELAAESGIPESVIVEKYGLQQKRTASAEETPFYMGIRAAQSALADSGLLASELDVVMWAGGQHKDYVSWLAGTKIASELHAVNAWSFDMSALCGSMICAIEIARSLLAANARLHNILLVSGYRDSDLIDMACRETSFLIDVAAGGSALVIQKNAPKNRIMGTAFKSDGSFAEDCVVEYGGAKHWPPKEEDLRRMHYTVREPARFKERLKAKTVPNFIAVIREALLLSGMSDEDIDYLAILHLPKASHNHYLSELGLTEAQSTYLDQYGHLGQNDSVLSIQLGIESGKITEGSNVVMTAAGVGFIWAAAVIRWGSVEESKEREGNEGLSDGKRGNCAGSL